MPKLIEITLKESRSDPDEIVMATDNFAAIAQFYAIPRQFVMFLGPCGDDWLAYTQINRNEETGADEPGDLIYVKQRPEVEEPKEIVDWRLHTPLPWNVQNSSNTVTPDMLVGPGGNTIAECMGYSVKATDKDQKKQGGREANALFIWLACTYFYTMQKAISRASTVLHFPHDYNFIKEADELIAVLTNTGFDQEEAIDV